MTTPSPFLSASQSRVQPSRRRWCEATWYSPTMVARSPAARRAIEVDVRDAMPVISLRGDFDTWTPTRTLLASDRFAAEFVVEMEDDGRAHLRFGDDLFGRVPSEGTSFTARYRLGTGSSGNVGAEALCRLIEPVA